jgi:hypothetical protein
MTVREVFSCVAIGFMIGKFIKLGFCVIYATITWWKGEKDVRNNST